MVLGLKAPRGLVTPKTPVRVGRLVTMPAWGRGGIRGGGREVS